MSSISPLGTLLATRLDAVLGTTLAQHPTLLNVRPGQAAQPASALHPQDNVIRRALDPAADAAARGARRTGAQVATDARTPTGQGRAELPPASARATLSEPAKAILALLVARPDVPPAVRGTVSMLRLAAASTHLPAPGGMVARGGPSTGASARATAANSTPSGAATSSTTTAGAAGAATPMASPQPAAGRAATQAATLPAGADTTPSQSTPPRLSGEASSVAGQRATTPLPPTAGQVPGTPASAAPMATSPGFSSPMAQAMATALARSVGESGLFYESHLAKLAFGQRRPETIMREPQALLGRLPTRDAGAPQASAQRATPDGAATVRADAAPSRAGDASPGMANANANTPLPPIPGIHPDATALVRQQLEVLAHTAFQWQGQAWEDVPMQWEIDEQTPAEGDVPGTWSTRLRLELPRLGVVEARLSIAGSQLVLRLVAEHSAGPLQASASVLRERLSGAGLVLSELAIHHSSTETSAP